MAALVLDGIGHIGSGHRKPPLLVCAWVELEGFSILPRAESSFCKVKACCGDVLLVGVRAWQSAVDGFRKSQTATRAPTEQISRQKSHA